MLKSCFIAYVLSSLEYCGPVWRSSVESYLGLLDGVVRSAERLCEGKISCLGHRRKVSVLDLLYYINHRVGHPMNECLHYFLQLVLLELQLLWVS